jgi:hypothetical protein
MRSHLYGEQIGPSQAAGGSANGLTAYTILRPRLSLCEGGMAAASALWALAAAQKESSYWEMVLLS